MINWADATYIECVGFDRSLLPYLQNAIDNGVVKWGKRLSSQVASDGRYSEFDYLGFRYAVDELHEPLDDSPNALWDFVPVRVEKIAKVDEDDDGNTIIVEKYPLTSIKTPTPAPRPAEWGSF